jgi:hypothetical protein
LFFDGNIDGDSYLHMLNLTLIEPKLITAVGVSNYINYFNLIIILQIIAKNPSTKEPVSNCHYWFSSGALWSNLVPDCYQQAR